jgi:hypothetical protein
MDQDGKAKGLADDLPKAAVARRPWHAPRFLVTDVFATDAMCNGGFDNANSAPSQS